MRRPSFSLGVLASACLAWAACSQYPVAALYPTSDLRPPGLLEAGPAGPRQVILRFDEAVTTVAGSLAAQPAAQLGSRTEGESLFVEFEADQAPGADYALAGEVEDARGNRTRFLVRFVGWNDRAPLLRLSEVEPCKNTSKTAPHRDFIELEALGDGNLGGEELAWASTVKAASYRFPGIEVRKGDLVVLHLAPEGLPEEVDELGGELAASGGIDASATGRDLWRAAMPLPDASGAISVSLRPGRPPMDGLFYSDDSKSGPLGEGRLADLLYALRGWALAGLRRRRRLGGRFGLERLHREDDLPLGLGGGAGLVVYQRLGRAEPRPPERRAAIRGRQSEKALKRKG